MGLLDKLMFWRKDEPLDEIAGCFTLPGADLDQPAVEPTDEDCAEPERS